MYAAPPYIEPLLLSQIAAGNEAAFSRLQANRRNISLPVPRYLKRSKAAEEITQGLRKKKIFPYTAMALFARRYSDAYII